MITPEDLTPAELAALLHFHAEAGVAWLIEDEPIDRFAEFHLMNANRQAAQSARPSEAASREAAIPSESPMERRLNARPDNQTPQQARAVPAIPNEKVIEQARFAAESARSLPELKTALEAFNGCNLKSNARSTIFASGRADSGVMIIGPTPNADDDREGVAFAGRSGQMLDRMIRAIGLERGDILLTSLIPWRTPGNRMPSAPEIEICRPFIERQIVLAEPKILLLLGNFTARFFFGGNDAIHNLRGRWREVQVSGLSVPAIASLHPQELLTAPINKRLAWSDLLALQERMIATKID